MKRCLRLLPLSREHHSALVLVRQITLSNAGDHLRWIEELPRIFAEELEPHFQAEEADLLPQLDTWGENALVERTLQEHQQMRELVTLIKAGNTLALKTFADLLYNHVRFEERELFLKAEQKLPQAWINSE